MSQGHLEFAYWVYFVFHKRIQSKSGSASVLASASARAWASASALVNAVSSALASASVCLSESKKARTIATTSARGLEIETKGESARSGETAFASAS